MAGGPGPEPWLAGGRGRMSDLSGRAALITGCGRREGIGASIARALAAAGAWVAVSDIRGAGTRHADEREDEAALVGWQGIESLKAEIEATGSRALTLLGDVSQREEADRQVGQ